MNQVHLIERIIDQRLAEGTDGSFYVLNIEDVRFKYRKWVEKMPRVFPFYAVKCNDDIRVLKALVDLGSGFDCASITELKQMLELGVKPERIIYAHTAKQISHLKYAADKQVMKVTFDCSNELMKIKEFHPKAEVVLRIRFDAANALICLGLKFGCDPIEEAPKLIQMCRDFDLNLIGVSFHVGSGTQDAEIFEQALSSVRQVFDVAINFGFKLNFVDIGGGFMGNDISRLDHYAKFINSGIEKNFSDLSIQIISEPGRYFVESAFTLAAQVVLKRTLHDGHIFYYIDEGIFLSFLQKSMYNEKLNFKVIRKSLDESKPRETISTIWGSSCNSKDKIVDKQMLPEMEMGDWLVFHDMGAYTMTCSTSFNGFKIGGILSI